MFTENNLPPLPQFLPLRPPDTASGGRTPHPLPHMVRPEKLEALKQRMTELGIREDDLEEKFVRGTGNGGQKVNKTNNCVFLRHIPSGIAVKCHMERSREINRFLARRELCDAYEGVIKGERTAKRQAIEKLRRQKRRKSRRQRQRTLADKHHHSSIKSIRRQPVDND